MKVWISKYVVSQGIIELDVGEDQFQDGGILHIFDFQGSGYNHLFFRGEWSTDPDTAKEQACPLVVQHIKDLEKRIEVLIQVKNYDVEVLRGKLRQALECKSTLQQ